MYYDMSFIWIILLFITVCSRYDVRTYILNTVECCDEIILRKCSHNYLLNVSSTGLLVCRMKYQLTYALVVYRAPTHAHMHWTFPSWIYAFGDAYCGRTFLSCSCGAWNNESFSYWQLSLKKLNVEWISFLCDSFLQENHSSFITVILIYWLLVVFYNCVKDNQPIIMC